MSEELICDSARIFYDVSAEFSDASAFNDYKVLSIMQTRSWDENKKMSNLKSKQKNHRWV